MRKYGPKASYILLVNGFIYKFSFENVTQLTYNVDRNIIAAYINEDDINIAFDNGEIYTDK